MILYNYFVEKQLFYEDSVVLGTKTKRRFIYINQSQPDFIK